MYGRRAMWWVATIFYVAYRTMNFASDNRNLLYRWNHRTIPLISEIFKYEYTQKFGRRVPTSFCGCIETPRPSSSFHFKISRFLPSRHPSPCQCNCKLLVTNRRKFSKGSEKDLPIRKFSRNVLLTPIRFPGKKSLQTIHRSFPHIWRCGVR